jgi:hypothetical protein
MSRWRVIFSLILLVSIQLKPQAQSAYSSYSILGVGDYVDPAVPAAMGMAGLGISNGSYFYLNNVNPALLYYNALATFSAGILAETKTINQTGFEPYQAGSGNLQHLAVAYPLKRGKWSFSLGLQPYTSVNYSFFYNALGDDPNNPGQSIILNEGSGGITALNFSVGGKVFKGLSVGLKGSYLFSSYEKEYLSITDATAPSYLAAYYQRQAVSDFVLGAGIAYQQKIGDYQLGLGAIYDFQSDVNSTEFVTVEQRTLQAGVVFSDTISDNVASKVSLPSTLGFGISFGKPQNWLVGFDYKTQDWSLLSLNDPSASSESFTIGKKYVLGAEFIADPMDVRSYLKRITFRAGLSFEEKPYVLQNTQINEFGINFGWSLPVSRFSNLDFGLMLGNRGTTDNNLVREDFFKVYFGATFNDNRWFIRPKFN